MKILSHQPKFIILHRQRIAEYTYSEEISCGYGDGLKQGAVATDTSETTTFKSYLGTRDIEELCVRFGYVRGGQFLNAEKTDVSLLFSRVHA